jgi:hypothetical protein
MQLITPGIRPASEAGSDDQKRVMTPADAARAGSTYIVVGRPILKAADPAQDRRQGPLLAADEGGLGRLQLLQVVGVGHRRQGALAERREIGADRGEIHDRRLSSPSGRAGDLDDAGERRRIAHGDRQDLRPGDARDLQPVDDVRTSPGGARRFSRTTQRPRIWRFPRSCRPP